MVGECATVNMGLRDPAGTAVKWAQTLKIVTDSIWLVGCASQYPIQALLESGDHFKIFVPYRGSHPQLGSAVTNRVIWISARDVSELQNDSRSPFYTEKPYQVFLYLPEARSDEDYYTRIYQYLTCRTGEFALDPTALHLIRGLVR